MSHRVTDRIARDRGEIGKSIADSIGADSIGADIDSVHAVESISLTISETVCESPVMQRSLPADRLRDRAAPLLLWRMPSAASLIRRVAKLLENETDERVIEILRGKP